LYKRILLKLSGEALAGESKVGLDEQVLNNTCQEIKKIHDMGVEIAIVVGGGNFWRGKYGEYMERTSADYMGMLATAINAVALQEALEKIGLEVRVQTAIEMKEIAEPFIQRKAMDHLKKNKIVIFACGTGSPFFSTDTCAALRATQIKANAILVAKTIDGIYSADPKEDPNAKKYDHISFKEYIDQDLKVMDITAITMCRDNNIPVVVFGMSNPENFAKAINEEPVGTTVS
jgi:uridylate kinase